jgi:Rps23 Pro-64 3,4-dihydroxylase Tpa1-like proline 4-hydroxylase
MAGSSGASGQSSIDLRVHQVLMSNFNPAVRTIQQSRRAMTMSPLGVFDDPKFARLAVESAEAYRTAPPFPHIAFDDFMDSRVTAAVADAYPMPEDINWVVRDTKDNLKRYQHDETMLPRLVREMLREFNSRQFVLFLETLTGIDNLIPDPYFIGGGAHLCSRGDFLNIHADFNYHHKLQAYRRVNVLFYLNPDWREEWGGALEFWDREMTGPVRAYFPMFNRLVVFNTNEHSNHGHPHRLECPPDRHRRALNLYYYTTRSEGADVGDPHWTIYKTQRSEFAVELGESYRRSGVAAGD